jgi:solute carrier family 66 (lysosomal lysine-arginine transporter), member 1
MRILTLLGAVWAGLVPTVIASAIYFCFADFVLIAQCLYYNRVNARRHTSREDEPLLARQRSSDTVGLPGSRRRSSARRRSEFGHDTLSKILEEDDGSAGSSWIQNAITIVLVALAGTAGWVIAWRSGVWTPTPENGGIKADPIGAKIFGYFSAVCYLG